MPKGYEHFGERQPNRPKLSSHLAHNTRQTDTIVLNKTFGFDLPVATYIPHRCVLLGTDTIAYTAITHGIYVLLVAKVGLVE